jgi:hypothetical protein
MLAQVGTGGFESFVERAVVDAELAHALFEGGVLGGDPLNSILCPFGFQIADAAKELADGSALGKDLAWAVLSASSALSARSRQVASRESSASASSRHEAVTIHCQLLR